ncbi:hypothetical protein TNCT_417541 [Trichonephila clavata]|uniref:Uncharacterized protein n=1 Tax=Trichonephila clavata TaxID=2740835 RepID=A0A8X6H8Q5_TRICU|nr:hypothetical protein TNCT_417541 [Trichonephila clavata]
MKFMILYGFVAILVIAQVESQELQCGCDANEYCFRPNIPFIKLNLCLPFKRKGFLCNMSSLLCDPQLECRERFLRVRTCQDPSNSTSSIPTIMPTVSI